MDGTMVAVMVICSVVLAAGGLGSLTWGKLNDRVIPHIISFICFVGCAILLSIFIDDMNLTNGSFSIDTVNASPNKFSGVKSNFLSRDLKKSSLSLLT